MARIVVIGAGLGAMAAAARLAVAGHRVTVYERGSTYGGAVGRHERDGFAFDTGPGLLHLPAVYRDLFVKTGKEALEECVTLTQVDPASRHVFADGTRVDLPNASRAGTVAALDAALGPGAGERWGEFLVRAREAWDRTRRPLLEEPQPADPAPPARDPYPALKAGLLRRPTTTLAQIGARELRDPRLAALLDAYAWTYGFDPATAPASAAVLPYMEQTFGSWYVAGACGRSPTRCTSAAGNGVSSSSSTRPWRTSWRRTAGRWASGWPAAGPSRPTMSSRGRRCPPSTAITSSRGATATTGRAIRRTGRAV